MLQEIADLKAVITTSQRRIAEIQANCDHISAARKGCSNTGNYDPSADAYWWDCHCPRCDKRWMEDQ